MINWFNRRKKYRGSGELDALRAQAYDYLDVYELDGRPIPLILFENGRFGEIMSWVSSSLASDFDAEGAGRGFSVKTDLNVLRDFMGHVFVEVVLEFPNGITERIMINANIHLNFFEQLAASSMLAIGPMEEEADLRAFVIQLPMARNAEQALDMIKKGLYHR